ncbi:hypothetical protein Cylst_3106 [Cylindrospermum stagnale PCC 7417]|uniref:Type I restriction enzyme R protein N-terminal domain-containing protein n=1 Tax=Cylindrospermum stagnale PCC 7417 TaxID=56107 RepID=K9WZN2_9NOST|nr:hypothetical protein [Cylindrospermum stagnale]AFZ25274.1 hypothetical protein Cylst_3106 [Cylindrospermum stagnale PCC 7417]
MTIMEPIQQFITWLQAFEHHLLQNEADVANKFVLPVFQYLGYPDKCRHDQYPLKIHNLGNQVIKSEIAHIYFSTNDVEKQNADTALIIVQVEELQQTNLDQAIEQAKFYSVHLKPLFFIVTNGYYIKVFQRLHYHWEELVIDINIDALKNPHIASEFYKKLNFCFVKSIDKYATNILTYTKYKLIEKSFINHPHLQNILERSNFQPANSRENNCVIVVQPKIAIECNLPKAFVGGDCVIEFSGVILRGLKISLNHQYILGKFMIGMNTKPDWGCRSFLRQLDKNAFEVYLGQTTVILSDLETVDLCFCIDAVCQEYQKTIIEFENALETWNFEFIEFMGIRGFYLFSVEQSLWELMQKFANEFDYAQGKSEWHIFHQGDISIRVSRGIRDHAFILPKYGVNFSLTPNKQINIIYELNDVHLQSLERGKVTSWQQDIGPRGTWTARYTKQWLLEKYIPKVINYYSQHSQLSEAEWLSKISIYQYERASIKEIDDIRDLVPYLRDIQSWLHIYKENIAASLLRPYYKAFTDLVRNTDSAILGMDYIMGNLRGVEWRNSPEEINSNSLGWTFKDALNCLDAQVVRINNCEYEKSLQADLITRTFIWMIEHGKISFSQSQINAAKQALLPLWELSRFEMRHVYPHR